MSVAAVVLPAMSEDAYTSSRLEKWEPAMARLTREKAKFGKVSNQTVLEVAQVIGVTDRQVRRRMAKVASGGSSRKAFVATDEHMKLALGLRGAKYAYDELTKQGKIKVSPRTFYRGLQRLDPIRYHLLTQGEAAVEGALPWASRAAYYRNHQWAMDAAYTQVSVRFGDRIVVPWIHVVMDVRHRLVMAVTILPCEISSADTRATLLAAVSERRVLVEGQWHTVGGLPACLHSDNGPEERAWILTMGLAGEVTRTFSDPKTPRMNPYVERIIRTFKAESFGRMVGFQEKARPHDERMTRPAYDPETLFTFEEFVAVFNEYVRHYNETRAHSELDGKTPLQSWLDDPSSINTASPQRLAAAMTISETRPIRGSLVEIFGATWTHGALFDYTGRQAEIRAVTKENPDSIVVFVDGQFICRIWNPAYRKEDEADAIRRKARQARAIVRGAVKSTARTRADHSRELLAEAKASSVGEEAMREAEALAAIEDDYMPVDNTGPCRDEIDENWPDNRVAGPSTDVATTTTHEGRDHIDSRGPVPSETGSHSPSQGRPPTSTTPTPLPTTIDVPEEARPSDSTPSGAGTEPQAGPPPAMPSTHDQSESAAATALSGTTQADELADRRRLRQAADPSISIADATVEAEDPPPYDPEAAARRRHKPFDDLLAERFAPDPDAEAEVMQIPEIDPTVWRQ